MLRLVSRLAASAPGVGAGRRGMATQLPRISQEDLYEYLKDKAYDFSGSPLRYRCDVSLFDLREAPPELTGSAAGLMENNVAMLQFARPEERAAVREYMVRTFYRVAPLPKALRLADSLEVDSYLEREIDNMFDCGLSQIYTHKSSGEWVGAGVQAAWKPDPDYPVDFETTCLDWMNVAARIAQESTADPLRRSVIWRDFQWQLIHHYGQKLARERGKEFIVYAGASHVEPRFRTGETGEWLVSFGQMANRYKALFYFLGTLPRFERTILKQFSGMGTIFDVANYRDLRLELDEGEDAFTPLADMDGLVWVHANM